MGCCLAGGDGVRLPERTAAARAADARGATIDVSALERRRDRVVGFLRGCGYEVGMPQATFYLLPRVPRGDEAAFVERLAARDVYVLPGAVVELPGYFRVSLTASDAMVERALPAFAAMA